MFMFVHQNPNFFPKTPEPTSVPQSSTSSAMSSPFRNMSGSASGFSSLFFMLFFLANAMDWSKASLVPQPNGTYVNMVPVIEEGRVDVIMLNESRRRLGSFRTCAMCTCCGGAKGLCLATPCCYAINCNIPNRPFGFCSFTPKTCNCFGCHL